MLTLLRLENFKIWKKTGPIRLAPITFLLGTNSSGKSSLIQALLLIRQTVKNGDDNHDLNLGSQDSNDSVTLGQFKDLLCHFASFPRVGIEFRWSASGIPTDSALFSARYRKGPAGSAELDLLRIGKGKQGFIVERKQPGIYRLLLGDEKTSRRQSADFRPLRSFTFSQATLSRLGNEGESIRDIGPQLLEELSRIIYLGPVRRLAQRDYVWSGRMPVSICDDGARAVDALIASGVSFQHAKRRKMAMPSEAYLLQETVKWLKAMELADDLSIRGLGGSSRYELLLHRHGNISNIKDVGVGVSQVLPVIVAALQAEPGHIVIVEEPESHLHPLAESLLAELFVTVSKVRNVQFIIETHSEHLFRRMQTLLAKEEISPAQCAMYFVERGDKEATLRELAPDPFGRINNWPPNFFGDALEETREQARLMFERQKQVRAK